MTNYRAIAMRHLASIAPRYLPFADVATKDVPLSQLLRLSLFQITVGMALVLLVGTLNRVMIVELNVPATLVAGMIALPLVFAPMRTLIGFRSDTHRSALGWRRVPYIWKGTMYQFGGFAVMPFALLVLSGYGEAADLPSWIGLSSAALAFLLVGAGVHMVQTVGLALATDLVKEDDHPKVVGLMYVMLLLGMVASALVYGALLENYTPGRLIQVVQGTAVLTILLNLVALWKQEARDRTRAREMDAAPPQAFRVAWSNFVAQRSMLRLMAVIALGTFGYGMADVLLEPYGGQVLGLSVAQTTKLTAILAAGTLIGFGVASSVLGRGGDPARLGLLGALVGIPGFAAIVLASVFAGPILFVLGTGLTGMGAGLFGHATLTTMIRKSRPGQIGLSIGAWGAVQAMSAGIGVALAGLVRDLLATQSDATGNLQSLPYNVVFTAEIAFLALAILVAIPLIRRRRAGSDRPDTVQQPNVVEVS